MVRALIDSDLDQTIKHKLDVTVPIFKDGQNQEGNDESMMKLLEEQIMIRHPLAVRRRDFLKHALKHDHEQPRRLLVVRCSARTARGSMPTPPIQL